jgi:23S rRNA (uracil1939-C5)-methyltransferase
MSYRREAGCEALCRGCAHRDLTAVDSLARKLEWAKAELPVQPNSDSIRPILATTQRWRYRKKSTLHARWRAGWQFGMVYYIGREEIFVPIPNCPIHSTQMNSLLTLLRSLPNLPLHAVVLHPPAVICVLKQKRDLESLQVLKSLTFPLGTSLFVNWNETAGKRLINSKHLEKIHGHDWIEDQGYHSPVGFRQHLTDLHQQSLQIAEDWLRPTAVVLDFYSGSGLSVQRWRHWADTLGVEISPLAAAEKNVPGGRFLRGRVEDRLPQVDEFLRGREFSLYTNPSRSGHHEKVIQWINARKPTRIAYLSCHPRSLAGDLKKLEGYQVKVLQPFDFFPQTDQLEMLALLERL